MALRGLGAQPSRPIGFDKFGSTYPKGTHDALAPTPTRGDGGRDQTKVKSCFLAMASWLPMARTTCLCLSGPSEHTPLKKTSTPCTASGSLLRKVNALRPPPPLPKKQKKNSRENSHAQATLNPRGATEPLRGDMHHLRPCTSQILRGLSEIRVKQSTVGFRAFGFRAYGSSYA